MSAKAKRTGVYVCPQIGTISTCAECKAPFPHLVGELLQKGQKVPACETHKVKLVAQ
jgi:hypothetical protein